LEDSEEKKTDKDQLGGIITITSKIKKRQRGCIGASVGPKPNIFNTAFGNNAEVFIGTIED
jgi:hypothetical protein